MLALAVGTLVLQPAHAQQAGLQDGQGALVEAGRMGAALTEGAGASEAATAVDPSSGPPADDGVIGLIEAPEGAHGVRAEATPDLGMGMIDDSAEMSSFAERRTAQTRMVGPIGLPPVVVELFTSQGCSSCPPADEMLNDLATREDILALSWHVDYWDYLGWADGFARPEFTSRQQDYARGWGERAVYTPQMVVGGADTLIAVRPADLMALVEAQMARPVPVLVTSGRQPDGFRIELTPREAARGRVAILLIRYAPERQVEIRAGENRGMLVTYRNVVLAVERVGEWDGGKPLRMTVTAKGPAGNDYPADTRHAILAQGMDGDGRASGPILAAIRLD